MGHGRATSQSTLSGRSGQSGCGGMRELRGGERTACGHDEGRWSGTVERGSSREMGGTRQNCTLRVERRDATCIMSRGFNCLPTRPTPAQRGCARPANHITRTCERAFLWMSGWICGRSGTDGRGSPGGFGNDPPPHAGLGSTERAKTAVSIPATTM